MDRTGKQPLAKGGRSDILTGFSVLFGGTGLEGGITTSSKFYIISRLSLKLLSAYIEDLSGCALRESKSAPVREGFGRFAGRSEHVRQDLLFDNALVISRAPGAK